MILLLACLIGVVAGLRALTPLAACALGARMGALDLTGTPLAFLGSGFVPFVLLALAAGELVSDKLPRTPSRKVPVQFAARLFSGALSGAMIGAHGGQALAGATAGLVGAVLGTLGGAALRARLATGLGRDLPAALIEDVLAIVGAVVIVAAA